MKKRMFTVLFKNNFINIFKNKVQFVGLLLLVFIATFIFTISNSSSNRIKESSDEFISAQKSNVHDFIIDFANTNYISDKLSLKSEEESVDNLATIGDIEFRQEMIMKYIQFYIQNSQKNLEFDYDRVETRTFNLSSNKILKAVSLNIDQKSDKLVVQKGMSVDVWNKYAQGYGNLTSKWAYISPSFAKANNINVNDIIRLQDDQYGTTIKVNDSELDKVDLSEARNKDINIWLPNSQYSDQNWFRVVGIGSSSDYLVPIINNANPIPNEDKEGIIYVSPQNFGWKQEYYSVITKGINKYGFIGTESEIQNLKVWYRDSETKKLETLRANSTGDIETYFVGKFKESKDNTALEDLKLKSNELDKIIKGTNTDLKLPGHYSKISNHLSPIITYRGSSDYIMANRFTLLFVTLDLYTLVSKILMITVFTIAMIVLFIILKKQIEKTAGQNGVLRSLGYNKKYIILAYIAYPLNISFLGGTIGFAVGTGLQEFIIKLFKEYFNLQIVNFNIDFLSLGLSVFSIFIMLWFVTLITSAIMMKLTPLEMINFEARSNTSRFKRLLKRMFTVRKKFDSKFQAALLSSSIAKISAVAITMFISTGVIAQSTIVPMILMDDIEYSYLGDEWDSKIEYYSPVYNNPMSFLKTYDPTATAWDFYDNENNYFNTLGTNGTNMLDNSQALLEMYGSGQINQEAYSPLYDTSTLSNMVYKNASQKYLKSHKQALDIKDQSQKDILYNVLISSMWKEYSNYGLDSWTNKNIYMQNALNYTNAIEQLDKILLLREFYLTYRNTIGLTSDMVDQHLITPDPKQTSKIKMKIDILDAEENKNYALLTKQDIDSLNLGPNTSTRLNDTITDGHLSKSNEVNIKRNWDELLKPTNPNSSQNYENIIRPILFNLYNWLKLFFINNISSAFLQSVYNTVPYNVKSKLTSSFEDENGNYSINFGVIPYTPSLDAIGTKIEASIGERSFNIYGLKNDSKSIEKLIDKENYILNDKLFTNNKANKKSIIINQTLAKQLNLNVGDNLDNLKPKYNKQFLTSNSQSDDGKAILEGWNSSAIDAQIDSKNSWTNSKYLYSKSIVKDSTTREETTTNGWTNKAIDEGSLFQSQIDLGGETPVGPTIMEKDATNGSISITSASVLLENYNIVGISNQYGEAKAWINNDLANDLLGYDKIVPVLFQIFAKEWSNPYQNSKTGFKKDLDFSKYIVNNSEGTDLYNQYIKNYELFVKEQDKINNGIWLRAFKNEYPIFNYKMSKSNKIDDIESGLSTSQVFGDYSVYGLQGGKATDGVEYPSYQTSSMSNILVKTIAQDTMNDIFGIANILIYSIIAISVIMSFMIIMLTINVVITENAKIIATMKVLGYRNRYITRLVLGMYFPIVFFTTILGFIAGWYMLGGIITSLSSNGLVVPFIFRWWIPFISIFISWTLYGISLLISWIVMTKVKLLYAVQESK